MEKLVELSSRLSIDRLTVDQCNECFEIIGSGESITDEMATEVMGDTNESWTLSELVQFIEKALASEVAIRQLDVEDVMPLKQLLTFAFVGLKKFSDSNGTCIQCHFAFSFHMFIVYKCFQFDCSWPGLWFEFADYLAPQPTHWSIPTCCTVC
jgi:hypothetical protein